MSSHRVMGMGGAYVGVAEGADGHLNNPASFAVRFTHTADVWYDWDFALSWLNVGVGDDVSIDRSGRSGFKSANLSQLGFDIKLGRHGFGLHLQSQEFQLEPSTAGTLLTYAQRQGGIGYAYAFLDGDLTLGLLINTGSAEYLSGGKAILTVEGSGNVIGVLWAPCGAPWRLGSAVRAQVVAGKLKSGDSRVVEEGVELGTLVIPTELSLGVSYMIGRAYNICPTYGDWEDKGEAPPLRKLPRRYLLGALDLVMTGKSTEATGVQAHLDGEFQASGEEVSLSLRAGLESEVIPDELVLRAGSYYEPSRFMARAGRWHGTLGGDWHLSWLWGFKLSATVDVAEGYNNFGLGLGFWH